MNVAVDGTQLWYDVDGPALVPDGDEMRERPTVVLVHGGPGVYDHSYFKPHFERLAEHAQVVYLDLRGHGRSDWGDASTWTLEECADDLRAFCDAVGIVKPFLLGHSMGGAIVLLYGARHPEHAGGLIVLSGFGRFDVPRLVEGVRRVAGDEVAAFARRSYLGDEVADDEWAQVYAAFGPHQPSKAESARAAKNLELNRHGMDRIRATDMLDQLGRIQTPTLVEVGELDPITPIAAAEEIMGAMPEGLAQLEVLEGAGHFPWLDAPDRLWATIYAFIGT